MKSDHLFTTFYDSIEDLKHNFLSMEETCEIDQSALVLLEKVMETK